MVPVFIAPRIEKKAVEVPPPAKSGVSPIVLGLLVVLLLGGFGGRHLLQRVGKDGNNKGTAATVAHADPAAERDPKQERGTVGGQLRGPADRRKATNAGRGA